MSTAIASTPPHTWAASLFVSAFNIAYQDDRRVTVAVHTSSGSSIVIAGALDAYRMRFDPVEVDVMLSWLTRAVTTDERAVITVTAEPDMVGCKIRGWAWRIGTGTALDFVRASRYFDDNVSLVGAEQQHVTIGTHVADLSADGVTTVLTDDVRTVIRSHAEPERTSTEYRHAMCVDGTITVHVDASDEAGARHALKLVEHKDFRVGLLTCEGHVIERITMGDADSAELISVGDVQAGQGN
ncbi:hypothetical protein ACIRP3_42255 [Streptomyces sp. NPDC101209]|uniref:hypothetical protein n=1 Tax=Streptomyces sp. NPDC101209 TaxID=3366129 RepID=UPI00380DB7E4